MPTASEFLLGWPTSLGFLVHCLHLNFCDSLTRTCLRQFAKMMNIIVFVALFHIALAGPFTRLGNSSTLPDWFVVHIGEGSGVAHPPVKKFRKQEVQTIEAEIRAAVGANGLVLDDTTLRDGNCGLDAILRSLSSVPANQLSATGTNLLQVLSTHGRHPALRFLRRMLLKWLGEHKSDEIVPGMTIEEFIVSDSTPSFNFDSFDQYVTTMATHGEWVDQTMMFAVSSVLNVHIVVFSGDSEPNLISSLPEDSTNAGTVCIAQAHNRHFWALQPGEDAGENVESNAAEHAKSIGDMVLANLCHKDRKQTAGDNDDDLATFERNTVSTARMADQDKTLFALSSALCVWSPFNSSVASGTGEVKTALTACGLDLDVFNVLKVREALKLMQLEQHDEAKGMPRALSYRAAKRFHATKPARQGMNNLFRKSRRLVGKVTPALVKKQILKPCNRGTNKPHTCLDEFRKVPQAICKWRAMWWSLTGGDRKRRLVQMFYSEFQRQMVEKHGDTSAFSMVYKFMGKVVCREAFMLLTGADTQSLQQARSDAMADPPRLRPHVRGELPCAFEGRAKKYLAARSWLMAYSEMHGDHNPIDGTIWLPPGHKHFYHLLYLRDFERAGGGSHDKCSINIFNEMWRTECAWIKLRTSHSPFTKCGLCEFLKGAMETAADESIRQALMTRLTTHYEFAAAQRLALSNLWKRSEQNPRKFCLISMDKMDQLKTIFPRAASLGHTDFQKTAKRLRVGLVGAYIPGVFKAPLVVTALDDYKHGGNMVSSILLMHMMLIKHSLGELPETIFLHADNTAKETKNTITLFTVAWLLAQLQGTPLKEIQVGFLMTGHTHDLVDAFFALVSRALRNRDCFSVSHLKAILSKQLTHPPIWQHMQDVYDMKGHRPNSLKSEAVPGITSTHHFRVRWDRDNNLVLSSKKVVERCRFLC